MRRALPLMLALSAALLASCSLTLWDYSSVSSKRYALVYGVAQYIAPPLAVNANDPNLVFPSDDASSVAQMLSQEGYAVTSRWVTVSGEEYVNGSDTLTNISTSSAAAPTKQNIAADVNTLSTEVGQNDIVVFYFSGHGMQDNSAPANEYFVPSGGIFYSPSSNWYYGDTSTSVSQNEFVSMLSVLGTKRKVVILDTCNSGGFIGNSLEADSIPAESLGSSGSFSIQALAQALSNYFTFSTSTTGLSPYGQAMVLSAAGRDESCYESSFPYYHGVMTYYLLQAPQSGDLNHDGHVTVAEAFSLVKAGIETDWNSNSDVKSKGETYEPRVSGGPIDYVLW